MEKLEKLIPRVKYTDAEKDQLSKIRNDCSNAAEQRSLKYIEFDGMDYETWYDKSKKASQGYIEPKINDEDVRVVTGTTREKGNILVNTFLNYNLEPDVTAYDDNDVEVAELGEVVEKMIRKSRRLEFPDWEVKRPMAYLEFVGQGNVHVEECWDGFSIPEKDLENFDWAEGVDPKKIKWKKRLNKIYYECNTHIINGTDVFPGNARQFFMEMQPFMVLRRTLSLSAAQGMYENWERFKSVPKYAQDFVSKMDTGQQYDDFQMIETDVDLVEEIRYFNKWTNEYQIMLNGVMMLPEGFPLSALIGLCEYPIAKGDCEPISVNFYWSRGVGSKLKTDQAMIDEMYKMMIIKTRKSYKPPLSNMTGQKIGTSIHLPGTIFEGLDPEKIKQIGEANGVTPAEFNMMQFVQGIIDEKSTSPSFEGQAPDTRATARQIIEQQQRSMVKIGIAILGIINLENRLAWLRLYNILKHWTDAQDQRISGAKAGIKAKYRTIDMEDTLEDGQQGSRIIEFTEDMPSEQQVNAEADLISYKRKKNVQLHKINPKELKNLKYRWEINTIPTEKNTSDLKAALFSDYMKETLAIFAPLGKVPNIDYLADRHALVNQEDPNRIWGGAQQQPQMPGQEQPPVPGNSQLTSQLQPREERKQPSAKALL